MSLADFDATVLEIITEFGTMGTYNKVTPGVYNPATGTATTVTTAIPVKVMLMDLTLQSNGQSVKYGTEILAGDKEGYLVPPIKSGGPAIVVDTVNDSLTVAGIIYSIETFKEVNPSGVDPILYSLYLRR